MGFTFSKRYTENLPLFGLNYMRHVLAEYRIAPAPETEVPQALKTVLDRADQQPMN
jgi:hypothetical protein